MKNQVQMSLMLMVVLGSLLACTDRGGSSAGESLQSLESKQLVSSTKVVWTVSNSNNTEELILKLDKIQIFAKSPEGVFGKFEIDKNGESIDLANAQDAIDKILLENFLPAHYIIKEIRLILTDGGHLLVLKDGRTCELTTPSGEQSGVKIKFPHDFEVSGAHSYLLRLKVDLDGSSSEEAGHCKLHPVIRVIAMDERKSECHKIESEKDEHAFGLHRYRSCDGKDSQNQKYQSKNSGKNLHDEDSEDHHGDENDDNDEDLSPSGDVADLEKWLCDPKPIPPTTNPSPTPAPTPEPTATPTPTATPSSTPVPTMTPAPTMTPVPTTTPAPTMTPVPTVTPTATPFDNLDNPTLPVFPLPTVDPSL